MERFEQQEEKSPLEQFQDEIEELKAREEETGEAAHLRNAENIPGVDTAELIDEDREIWQKFKDNTLTSEKFQKYRNDVASSGNNSRGDFVGFVGNKLQKRMWEKKPNED